MLGTTTCKISVALRKYRVYCHTICNKIQQWVQCIEMILKCCSGASIVFSTKLSMFWLLIWLKEAIPSTAPLSQSLVIEPYMYGPCRGRLTWTVPSTLYQIGSTMSEDRTYRKHLAHRQRTSLEHLKSLHTGGTTRTLT